jgi:hypothetical protein
MLLNLHCSGESLLAGTMSKGRMLYAAKELLKSEPNCILESTKAASNKKENEVSMTKLRSVPFVLMK